MGNNLSTTSERQHALPSSRKRDAATGMLSGREQSAPPDVPKVAVARHVGPQSTPQSRIVVDIRSSNLDKDYNVYIKQEPQRDVPVDIASAWSGLQAVGALCITVLTIQKLWEDIKFIRLLRRELSTLVGSLTDAGGTLDAGNGESNGARPARARGGGGGGGFGRGNSAALSPAGPPASRQLDLHLNELSDLLGGGRREGSAAEKQQANNAGNSVAAAAAAGGAAAVAAEGANGDQQLGHSAAEPNSRAGGGTGASRKETTWASISGLVEVKILLQEATVLPTLRPDLFQGIRQPPKALLLFGPPGTGKTLLARAVATESRATFLPVTGSSVLSMWYGQSEQNVKALFEKARKRQPAIIFIDEVDSLLGKRSSGGPRESTPDKRVTNEFLAFIDGIQTQQAGGSGNGSEDGGDTRIVVIAATNTPWDLDEAALSRFSRRIYVPLPDRATREALMRKAMEGIACDVSDADWQRLAERCDKYSGRDLVQVCREAAMRPLRELWGRRLLAGSPATHDGDSTGPAPQQTAAAQQRLAELVANSLAASAAKCGAGVGAAGDHRRGHHTSCGAAVAATAAAPKAAEPEAAVGRRAGRPGAHSAGAARPGAGWMGRFGFRWDGLGGGRYAHSKKQARRELERWKRRHGATWCDVEAVMEQAERLLENRRVLGGGTGPDQGAAKAGNKAAEPSVQQNRVHHLDLDQGLGDSESGRQQDQQALSGPQLLEGSGACALVAPGPGGPPAASQAGDDAEEEGVCVRVQVQVQEGALAAADADAVRPEAAHVRVRLRVQGGDSVEAASPASSSATASTSPAAAAPAAAGGTATAGGAPTTTPGHRAIAGGGSQEAATPGISGGATGASDGGAASRALGARVVATTTAPASTDCAVASAGGGSTATGGGGNGCDDALSLEGLLALPAARVRPVTAADLEAALQIISCTEMDQTAKYTEWDEQYGSGATQSGRQGGSRGRVWMSMYA